MKRLYLTLLALLLCQGATALADRVYYYDDDYGPPYHEYRSTRRVYVNEPVTTTRRVYIRGDRDWDDDEYHYHHHHHIKDRIKAFFRGDW